MPEPHSQSFTLSQLKQRDDWPEWKASQYKMLDQYLEQGMFSDPQPLPKNANALHMLWTYTLKTCGTKKARLVCNGNPRQKGTVTLRHTYANSLDASSERLFWAIVAQEGLIAIAPPPEAPLFLYTDEAFREWWIEHLRRPPIPREHNVVRVNNAIQGHPESPRLWEKHIDHILKDLEMKPTTHEPCLYSGIVEQHRIIFLRQVDDFAAAAKQKQYTERLIQLINNKLQINIKLLGTITRFNGMDIHQTQNFIKIKGEQYLTKMIPRHPWISTNATPMTPLPSDSAYIQAIEQATPPSTNCEQSQLQQQMGFNYRRVISELLYPMVKCRPDFAFHITKLSQYMANPAKEHYLALQHLCQYVANTITAGIHYWRHEECVDMPLPGNPTIHNDNYTIDIHPNQHNGQLFGYVDADWVADITHRKSESGLVILYAGGTIGYKSKYQNTISHSSTEAEFTAACEAGKTILFFRSLLHDLQYAHLPATIVHEDNNGALLMANTQQPTRRTRHMDIKTFALLDWVQQDLMYSRT
jgi:hypothetical protein